jgi:hypothetical protein
LTWEKILSVGREKDLEAIVGKPDKPETARNYPLTNVLRVAKFKQCVQPKKPVLLDRASVKKQFPISYQNE